MILKYIKTVVFVLFINTFNYDSRGETIMEHSQDKKIDPIILCESSLIEEIKLAVDAEMLPTQFTAFDVKKWMEDDHITKPDGTPYQEISTELLLNYSQHTPITKKRKKKVLYTSRNSRVFSFNPF